MRNITVTVGNDGTTAIEAFGYKGSNCTAATLPLTKALLGTPDINIKKAEFYDSESSNKLKETES